MPESNGVINGHSVAVRTETNNTTTNFSLRAEAVQDVISQDPGYMMKWSLLTFLLLLLLLLAGAWFIRYPEVLQVNATLTASDAPKEIYSRQSGRLVRLLAGNDAIVEKGAIIGWMEATGDHQEIFRLEKDLDTAFDLLQHGQPAVAVALLGSKYQHLGEIQAAYQAFVPTWQQFKDYTINGYYQRKKLALSSELTLSRQIYNSIIQEKQLTQEDIALNEASFKVNEQLFNEKVISRENYRQENSKLINRKLSLPQLEETLLQNLSQQKSKQREIDELDHTASLQLIAFQQALQTLRSQVADWIRKYTIVAGISGKISFLIRLQENQYLQNDQLIGYISPGTSKFYAQVNLPQSNFGKLNESGVVQLRLYAYPYQEFGVLEGKLNYISRIPSDSGFYATVSLPDELVTNYNKRIQYSNGLKAQAVIVTKDMRLLESFFYSIKQVLSR